MITLSSTAQLLAAISRARDVSLTAYTLPDGRVLSALEAAARSGAHVRVRLEGAIYKDDGTIGGENAAAIAGLRKAGADAQLVHSGDGARDPVLHAKVARVDGALYLDDRNWPDDGSDTIVRDDPPRGDVAFTKRVALRSEANLLREGQRGGDDVIVESESFGRGNRVYSALERAARGGAHVRVLVNARDLQNNARELAAIRNLEADGASVRVCDADEKLAVVNGTQGWIGSANATAAFSFPDQRDWGARTDTPQVLAHLRRVFEARWATSNAVS